MRILKCACVLRQQLVPPVYRIFHEQLIDDSIWQSTEGGRAIQRVHIHCHKIARSSRVERSKVREPRCHDLFKYARLRGLILIGIHNVIGSKICCKHAICSGPLRIGRRRYEVRAKRRCLLRKVKDPGIWICDTVVDRGTAHGKVIGQRVWRRETMDQIPDPIGPTISGDARVGWIAERTGCTRFSAGDVE